MKEDNQILQKSKAFAVRIIRLAQHLTEEKKEKVLSRQVLRSGTSIGANVKEAVRGQSTADFLSKMQIALKEASETEYWLELLAETDYLSEKASDSVLKDCRELIRLITSIVRSTKENNQLTLYEEPSQGETTF
ncbi:four helix bundle protein [Aristaeella hokkaidonensis]|uniref:Four helix bundle protein n=1 Tax=Aristaeella hokkaidonensis TaxID=3046382 RepID=A0AC61N9U4_9FIRM|nr:four helix bundle protein [Aristaeella hokkaidonensis]QUC68656.1 four helix bundle protein [Aristaeella hokkaidonensis]SNT94326.1 four helix bundle protein [Aristaeella hokkaidonensis]